MSFQVTAASVFGQFGAPGNAAYCASKAAVIGLSRTAAKENQHIRVNCVSPGKSAGSFNGTMTNQRARFCQYSHVQG